MQSGNDTSQEGKMFKIKKVCFQMDLMQVQLKYVLEVLYVVYIIITSVHQKF
jgi:hypothetical protein